MASFDKFIPSGFGWQRDLPDPRDFTLNHRQVESLLTRLLPCESPLPTRIDQREVDEANYYSLPEDQGALNAASAFACLAMIEYLERKIRGRTYEGSRRFTLEMSRKMSGSTGNAGVGIRSTLKTIQRFGAPPEELCPYREVVSNDLLHDASLIGFSRDLPPITYFRLDLPRQSGHCKLVTMRAMLAAGFPVVFGFPVPRSMTRDAVIPFRPRYDSYRGGQAVLGIGYDDDLITRGEGAILIRSSWGTQWGDSGYGWLPYAYLKSHLIADCWTVLSEDWADPAELASPIGAMGS